MLEVQLGVTEHVDFAAHHFDLATATALRSVTYTTATVWSADLATHLAAGWHVIVKGAARGSAIAAMKIVNDPAPERAACTADANIVGTAVAAYEAVNGTAPPTVASLTEPSHGGPYLQRGPGNRTFYRIALNWGGKAPGREDGGKDPGAVDAAGVWLGKVGTYAPYAATRKGCDAAT